MNFSATRKAVKKKQSKFQLLLQNLRNQIIFKSKEQDEQQINIEHKQPSPLNSSNNIIPVTQSFKECQKSFSQIINQHKQINPENSSDNIFYKHPNSDSFNDTTKIDLEEYQKKAKQQQFDNNNISRLKPQKRMSFTNRQQNIGAIVKQDLNIYVKYKKNEMKSDIEQSQYFQNTQLQYQNTELNQSIKLNCFKMLENPELIKYLNNSVILTQKSCQNEINRFFTGISYNINISFDSPYMKKYKKCVYFGNQPVQSKSYGGFIYYFSNKLYYGSLINGIKQGIGIEINIKDNQKFVGNFHQGKKIGYFYIQKNKQKYQGQIQYGIYHGQGKLITADYVYTGRFQHGKKHGYGQQIQLKTGVKLRGYFSYGMYSNLNQNTNKIDQTSQSQIINKLQNKSTKSKSYLINFHIMNRQYPTKDSCNTKIQQNTSNFQSKQDQLSVFDMMKNSQINKYDINIGQVTLNLPKIYVNDILSKQFIRSTSQDVIINKKFNQKSNHQSQNKFSCLNRNKTKLLSKLGYIDQDQQPLSKYPLIRPTNFYKF